MKMFGHPHGTQNHESVVLADLFQNREKQIAPAGRVQPRLAVIAAAGDEVKVAGAMISLEILGHGGNATTKAELASVTNDPLRRLNRYAG
jgi:hypothetical protein